MTSIIKRIAKLSPAKRRFLEQQIARIWGSDSEEPITPQPRDRGLIPLTFNQERLWMLHQREPESGASNLLYGLRIEGELAVSALQASFREVVRRHESLRTTFVADGDKPVQVIHPLPAFTLRVVALESLPRTARQSEINRLTAAAATTPFDLACRPLLRGLLLRLSSAEHILLLTVHPIIFDAYSLRVLTREVTAIYKAALRGRPSPLPELAIQFADYALWQRRWLKGEVLNAQLAYWRRQLAGAPPLLELPTDRPRSLRRGTRGRTCTAQFAASLHARLKELSLAQGCTPFVTLLTAFAVLLERYCGQSDVVVGSPFANRWHTEVEGLIGSFLNPLVLRLDLTCGSASRNPRLTKLLSCTRERVLHALDHQDLPFARLVEEVQPERSLGRRQLFQVLLVMLNTPRCELELPDLRIEPLAPAEQTEEFDLTLFLEETAGGELAARVRYSVELFDGTTIRRLLMHLRTLLEGMAADPRRRLSEIPIFTQAQRHQLVREWNDIRSDGHAFACCPWKAPRLAMPLGRSIANLRTYVLDARQEPVPVGATGELYIADPGLAWGYLGQPQLTAERFLPDPLASEAGGRRWRSGELARYRGDGTLEFLDCIDPRVKARAARVEPAELPLIAIGRAHMIALAVPERGEIATRSGLVPVE